MLFPSRVVEPLPPVALPEADVDWEGADEQADRTSVNTTTMMSKNRLDFLILFLSIAIVYSKHAKMEQGNCGDFQ
jgi:hypothetical protein